MKITAYPVSPISQDIKPAERSRDWMDHAAKKNPYRCLPLLIANSYGYELHSKAEVVITWNGGQDREDLKIELLSGVLPPTSHFGEGTITWDTGYFFQTEKPYGLMVSGPPNNPKSNIIPLAGIVETFWLPFAFTMNWKMTQPGQAKFEIGESICQIYPIDLSLFDNTTAEIKDLSSNPELQHNLSLWNQDRTAQGSERNYMLGRYVGESEKVPDHKTKLNVPEFKDLRESKV